MRKKIENSLIEMGIYPNLKGFGYICEAVEILAKNNRDMKIVDGVYQEIAEKFGVTKLSVERAIRHAIAKADREGEAFEKYIGSKCKNSEFLHALTVRMQEDFLTGDYNPQKDGAVEAIRIYGEVPPKATLAFAFGGIVEIEWTNVEERNKYASGINAYTLYFDERPKDLNRTFKSFIK